MNKNETITVEELDAAFVRLGYRAAHAQTLFENIKAHREPEWNLGDVVRDANHIVWMSAGHYWWCMATAGLHDFSVPKRPLKRLVEES